MINETDINIMSRIDVNTIKKTDVYMINKTDLRSECKIKDFFNLHTFNFVAFLRSRALQKKLTRAEC